MNSKVVKISIQNFDINLIFPMLDQIEGLKYIVTDTEIYDLELSSRGLTLYPDWDLKTIPFIFSKYIPINKTNIELAIQLIQENYEAIAEDELPENTLFPINFSCIKTVINQGLLYDNIYQKYIANTQFEEYAIEHNKAILLHYNSHQVSIDFNEISDQFKHASFQAPDTIWMAYTNYLFMIFLIENEKLDEAISIGFKTARRILPKMIIVKTLHTLYKVLTLQEYSSKYIEIISDIESVIESNVEENQESSEYYLSKSLFLDCQNEFEKAALALTQSLQCLPKNETQSIASVQAAFGDLYLKMAQYGDSSKYINSQKSYQEALKFYKKATFPHQYAHCQMNLGIIFAELPSVDQKKHIYAGLSQTAFTEAMHIYNKFEEPYQYATVCTNFSNALMRLLPDIDQDRFDKISFYLFEALNIRKPNEFPEERAISLTSMLNLYVHRIETAEDFNPIWFDEMNKMALEIKSLTDNEYLHKLANNAIHFVSQNTSSN